MRAVDHKRKGHGKAGNVGWSGKRKLSFQLAEEKWRSKRKPVILWSSGWSQIWASRTLKEPVWATRTCPSSNKGSGEVGTSLTEAQRNLDKGEE